MVGRFVSKYSEGWRDGLLAGTAGALVIDIFRLIDLRGLNFLPASPDESTCGGGVTVGVMVYHCEVELTG